MRVACIGLVLTTVAASCESGPAPDVQLSPAELRAVSTSVDAEGGSWTLEAEAWRSFQPITTPSGEPMIVVVRLKGALPLPQEFGVRSVVLLRGDSVWSGPAVEEHPRDPGAMLAEVVVRNAPRWGPGDSLDVVARVGRTGGPLALVRAPRILIARVD